MMHDGRSHRQQLVSWYQVFSCDVAFTFVWLDAVWHAGGATAVVSLSWPQFPTPRAKADIQPSRRVGR